MAASCRSPALSSAARIPRYTRTRTIWPAAGHVHSAQLRGSPGTQGQDNMASCRAPVLSSAARIPRYNMTSCRSPAHSSAARIPRYNMASCRSLVLSSAARIPRYTRTVQYGQRLNKVLNVFMESFKELSRVSKARKIEQKYRDSSYYLPKLTSNSCQ